MTFEYGVFFEDLVWVIMRKDDRGIVTRFEERPDFESVVQGLLMRAATTRL